MATRILHIAEASQKYLHRRFYPLELSFSYIALRRGRVIQSGWGETVEMSSSHVRVKPLGLRDLDATDIVMSVAWPAKLPDGTNLQLVIHTEPVRDSLDAAEFRILKHEYRTASKGGNGLGLRTEILSCKVGPSHEQRQPGTPARSIAAASGM
jgi:hypothetical protein